MIGHLNWVIEPYAEDWLEKANRIIDDDKRLALLEKGRQLAPENEQLKRKLLEEYKAQKKWKRAAGMLIQMAEEEESYDVLTDLLAIYRELKNTDGIIAVLRRILNLNPDDMDAREALADTLAEEGEWRKAIDEYEALLKRTDEKDRLWIYKRLGYLYTQTGEPKKAIPAYIHAAKLDQKDATIQYNLSYLYEQVGEKEKADFYLNNAITLKSNDLEGRLKLAERLMEKGRYAAAKEHLKAVLKKKPDSTEALVLMARILEKDGDKDGLKKIYEKLLSLSPQNDTLLYNLGTLEYETGNLDAARSYFSQYVTSHPDDPTVHEMLFDIYSRMNQEQKAFKEAMVLVKLRPRSLPPYGYIYDYLKENGRFEEILPVMQTGLEVHPNAVNLRAYLLDAYLKTGNTDGALTQAEALLEAKVPDILPWMEALFEYLVKKGDYPKIISIMQQGVKAYPETLFFRECLVVAYLKTQKEKRAIEQMEIIAKAKPEDAKLQLQLARLKEKNGDLPGAMTAYKKVIDLIPDHEEAGEAYLRLRLDGVKGE
ncbi:MAG: tetratricopeptide repeat protein [Deltaproteobacteria bacterium]|nr:tetratricopeptide repeat protein [Deltaproteobacteria bacterium]